MKKNTDVILILALLTLATTTGFITLTVAIINQSPNYIIRDPETNTWIVSPNGVDDTDNLQLAFDEASNYPGSTIQLTSGTFLLTRTIIIINFDGSFKGAGKGISILQTDDIYPLPFEGWSPDVFAFFQDNYGTLKFSDMTINVKGKHLGGKFGYFGNIFTITERYPAMFSDEDEYIPSHVDAFFERMEFKGEVGVYRHHFWPWNRRGVNMMAGIQLAGVYIDENGLLLGRKPISGTYSIIDCSFKDMLSGVYTDFLSDSTVTIRRNKFYCEWCDIFQMDLSNTHSTIFGNDLRGGCGWHSWHGAMAFYGFDLGPYGPLPEPSSYHISHNTFNMDNIGEIASWGIGPVVAPSMEEEISTLNLEVSHNTFYIPGMEVPDVWDPYWNMPMAIFLEDQEFWYSGRKSLNVVINHNTIELEGPFNFGIVSMATKDTVVTNNHIKGSGFAGILTGVWGPNDRWKIINNNVQNLEVVIAPIWLGPGTSNCHVIGQNTAETVLDEGIDNLIINLPFSW